MPLYSYICSNQHISEKLLTIAERLTPGPCPRCGGDLERIYLSRSQAAKHFDLIVIDCSPTGEYSFPMNTEAPVPEGYERREIRTFQEADAVLRRVNQAERRKIEQRIEQEHASLAHNEARNHGDLRSGFSYEGSDGKIHAAPPLHRMSPLGQALAKYAMQQAENRRPRTFDPGVFLEIREQDSSNRDPHEDARTGWRERRS